MKIRIANRKYYINNGQDTTILCHRPHMLGNPYIIGEHGTREQVIEKYRYYFYDKVKTDVRFIQYLKQIIPYARHFEGDVVLLCYCHPLPCHTEVIKEYLEKCLDSSSRHRNYRH